MRGKISKLGGNVLVAAFLVAVQVLDRRLPSAGGAVQGNGCPPHGVSHRSRGCLGSYSLAQSGIVQGGHRQARWENFLALVGDIPAAGFTAQALSKQVADRLAEFMSTPTVSVQVKEINSYHVFAVGEVGKPGKIVLKSFTSVLQGISYAGGFTLFASRNNVHVLRNVKNGQGETKQVMIPVPYQDIVQGKNLEANIILKAGDVIVVP